MSLGLVAASLWCRRLGLSVADVLRWAMLPSGAVVGWLLVGGGHDRDEQNCPDTSALATRGHFRAQQVLQIKLIEFIG